MIGEDALCCALGERIVAEVGLSMAQPAINKRGITRLLPELRRYSNLANQTPVLCVADTDGGCVVKILKDNMPPNAPAQFLFRLAVSESESWLLADRGEISKFLGVSMSSVPKDPDDVRDAKRLVLSLAAKSSLRQIREELVSSEDRTRPGSGYNVHLCRFVLNHWRIPEAASASPSLRRAVQSIKRLNAAS
ncbi:MAG TPA: hypothetical protein VIA18_29220 [Polyangia bacterium]|nr:hypothetical protein [Polyangia bacterium]